MFVEKYRPITFDELVGQEEAVKTLRGFCERKGAIPNLMFVGEPGTGKTTMAYILARTLFGSSYQTSFLELNASSDRGIDIVRGRIQEFARTRSFHKFKIIFLDEFSEITKDAQNALRRVMELNHRNCRFILACNYVDKVIEPIRSRCIELTFRKIGVANLVSLGRSIAEKENVRIKSSKLKLIALESNGDARKFLNLLEAVGFGKTVSGEEYRLNDLLSLSVRDFVELVYLVDNERLFHSLVDQAITSRHRKVVVVLAECDLRFRLGCIKTLQLISAFIKIKEVVGGLR